MPDRAKRWAASLLGLALSAPGGAGFAAGIDAQNFDQLERGRYLTIVGDCAACHTLPGSGHEFAGGRTIETPFGNLIAPNITPDPLTGIGSWTDQEFIDALTKGTRPQRRASLPGHAVYLLHPAYPR
jgi:hypothetical protein